MGYTKKTRRTPVCKPGLASESFGPEKGVQSLAWEDARQEDRQWGWWPGMMPDFYPVGPSHPGNFQIYNIHLTETLGF